MANSSKTFKPILTQSAKNSMLGRDGETIKLRITNISFGDQKYTPTGSETALKNEKIKVPISGTHKDGNSITFKTAAKANSGDNFFCGEVGLWDDEMLVAIYASTENLFYLADDIDTIISFSFVIEDIPTESIEIVAEPNRDLLIELINQHENAQDPHNMYVKKTDVSSTSKKGIVQLSNDTNSDAEDKAATSKAVKKAFDKCVEALNKINQAPEGYVSKTGDTMSGNLKIFGDGHKSLSLISNSGDQAMIIQTDGTAGQHSIIIRRHQDGQATSSSQNIAKFRLPDLTGRLSFLVTKDESLAEADLNTIRTDGVYYQNLSREATTWRNYPVDHAGILEALYRGNFQRYTSVIDNSVYQRRFNTSSQQWEPWESLNKNNDGVPIGSIVAFPKQVFSPEGFLRCNGQTFRQQTYPDLYRVLGNSNKLPDLTKSSIGQTAYFLTEQLPEGWIYFDDIATQVTQSKYPELYEKLTQKYGSISNVPKVGSRYLRNAGNDFNIGDKLKGTIVGADSNDRCSAFGIANVGSCSSYNVAVNNVGLDEVSNTREYSGSNLVFISGASSLNIANSISAATSRGGHFAGVSRPSTLVLKLAIKATENDSAVNYYIKAANTVINQALLDASQLSQELQNKANLGHTHSMSEITDLNFTQNLTENGWCRLPNGLLIQWVSASRAVNERNKLAFPIAFNRIFVATVSSKCFGEANYDLDIFYNNTHVWGRYQTELRVFAVGV